MTNADPKTDELAPPENAKKAVNDGDALDKLFAAADGKERAKALLQRTYDEAKACHKTMAQMLFTIALLAALTMVFRTAPPKEISMLGVKVDAAESIMFFVCSALAIAQYVLITRWVISRRASVVHNELFSRLYPEFKDHSRMLVAFDLALAKAERSLNRYLKKHSMEMLTLNIGLLVVVQISLFGPYVITFWALVNAVSKYGLGGAIGITCIVITILFSWQSTQVLGAAIRSQARDKS